MYQRAHIEITNSCNFHCEFCADCQMTRERRFMPPSLYYSIIDQIHADNITRQLSLYMFGESFLHKDMLNFIIYAKRKGIEVNITSNASVITEEHVRGMMSAFDENDSIVISFRSTNQNLFQIHDSPLAFDEYLNRIRMIIEMKSALNKRTHLHIHVFHETLSNATLMKRRKEMKRYIIDRPSSEKLIAWINGILGRGPGQDKTMFSVNGSTRELFYPEHNIHLIFQPLIEAVDETYYRRKKAIAGYCDMRYFTVLCDGTVGPCCNNFDGVLSFGNVNERPLKEIVYSSEALKFRTDLSRGRLSHDFCRYCRGHFTMSGFIVKQLVMLARVCLDPYGNRRFLAALGKSMQ